LSKKANILVTDATSRHMLAITRSLGKKGLPVAAASYQDNALVYSSRYCTQKLKSPRSSEETEYVNFLKQLTQSQNIEMIFAGSDNTAQYLSDHREEFPGLKNALPSKEDFTIANRKDTCLRKAMDVGVPVPKSWFPEKYEEVPALAEKIPYPVVVKGQLGSGSSHNRYAYDKKQLLEAYNEIYGLEKDAGVGLPTIQEYLTGKGFICGMLADHGEIIAAYQHHRYREYPITGGVSAIVESIDHPRILEESRKMVKALNWHGIIMTEFKHNPVNDTYNLLEINPRFWGATGLPVAAGIDFPYMYYKLSMGEKVEPVTSYNVGLKYIFLLPTALLSVVSYPKSWRGVAGPLFSGNATTDMDWSDLGPTLNQLKLTMYLLRQGVRKTETELVQENRLS
jgi:predicted ATP-grasp superfamily ATP-dependent carboligase